MASGFVSFPQRLQDRLECPTISKSGPLLLHPACPVLNVRHGSIEHVIASGPFDMPHN